MSDFQCIEDVEDFVRCQNPKCKSSRHPANRPQQKLKGEIIFECDTSDKAVLERMGRL